MNDNMRIHTKSVGLKFVPIFFLAVFVGLFYSLSIHITADTARIFSLNSKNVALGDIWLLWAPITTYLLISGGICLFVMTFTKLPLFFVYGLAGGLIFALVLGAGFVLGVAPGSGQNLSLVSVFVKTVSFGLIFGFLGGFLLGILNGFGRN